MLRLGLEFDQAGDGGLSISTIMSVRMRVQLYVRVTISKGINARSGRRRRRASRHLRSRRSMSRTLVARVVRVSSPLQSVILLHNGHRSMSSTGLLAPPERYTTT